MSIYYIEIVGAHRNCEVLRPAVCATSHTVAEVPALLPGGPSQPRALRTSVALWAPACTPPSAAAAGVEVEEGDIDLSEYPPGSKVVRDWKGDPMVITPGDRLPFIS